MIPIDCIRAMEIFEALYDLNLYFMSDIFYNLFQLTQKNTSCL